MRAKTLTLPSEPPTITPDELTEIASRYGIEVLGPPGTIPIAPTWRFEEGSHDLAFDG